MAISVKTSNNFISGGFGAYSVSDLRAAFSKSSEKAKRKKLNYNPREISLALMQVKRAQSAKQLTITARGKLASLLRCQGTGVYDDTQLRTAIIHAQKMVECAKLKAGHLADEEADKKQQDKMRRNSRISKEYDALIRQLEAELRKKKAEHRSKENKAINYADIEYLKRELEALKSESASAKCASSTSSASSSSGYADYADADVDAGMMCEAAPAAPDAGCVIDVTV